VIINPDLFQKCDQISMRYWRKGAAIRFIMVGFLNTAVDFAVFSVLLNWLGLNYLLCQVAGYSMGILNSFIFNKIWTFENQSERSHIQLQLTKFIIVNVGTLIASLIGLTILSDYNQLNLYLAKVLVTGVTLIINYVSYAYWVFPERKK